MQKFVRQLFNEILALDYHPATNEIEVRDGVEDCILKSVREDSTPSPDSIRQAFGLPTTP
jgi:hypothetical protein